MIIDPKWRPLVGSTTAHMRINPKLKRKLQEIKLKTEISSVSDVILLQLIQLEYIRGNYPAIHAEAVRSVNLPGYVNVGVSK